MLGSVGARAIPPQRSVEHEQFDLASSAMICLFVLFLAFVCYLWLLIAIYVKMKRPGNQRKLLITSLITSLQIDRSVGDRVGVGRTGTRGGPLFHEISYLGTQAGGYLWLPRIFQPMRAAQKTLCVALLCALESSAALAAAAAAMSTLSSRGQCLVAKSPKRNRAATV